MGMSLAMKMLAMGALSGGEAAAAWTPSSATDGGVSTHTWHYAGSGAVYTDSAETTLVANDGDVVGSSVSQGGDSHSIVQATTGNKPLYKTGVLNSKPVFRGDGINDFLSGAFSAALTQPFTVLAVAKLDASAVDDSVARFIFDGDDSNNRAIAGQYTVTSPDSWRIWAGTGSAIGGDSDSVWHIWLAYYNGASSQFWIDGVSEATGDIGTEAPDGLALGSRFDGGASWWVGDIAELIIYDSNLSTADKNQVLSYLGDKYDISVSEIA